MNAPSISVVLCTYRREDLALRAIEAVRTGSFGDYEILVVDQDPRRGLEGRIRQTFPGGAAIRYLFSPLLGLSHARNLGAEEARGAILAFLDDDARPVPGWLASYAEAFARRPAPAMVGGRILPEWEAPRPRWYPPSRLFLLGLYDRGDAVIPFPETDAPVGANFAILKSTLGQVGRFEPALGFSAERRSRLGGEDTLVALRVRQGGGLILYDPGATVFHRVSREKLRLTAFLRRHFVEGKTQVAVHGHLHGVDRRFLGGALRWHAMSMLKSALVLLPRLAQTTQRGECLGEWLAGLSLSGGAIHECLLRLPRARAGGAP